MSVSCTLCHDGKLCAALSILLSYYWSKVFLILPGMLGNLSWGRRWFLNPNEGTEVTQSHPANIKNPCGGKRTASLNSIIWVINWIASLSEELLNRHFDLLKQIWFGKFRIKYQLFMQAQQQALYILLYTLFKPTFHVDSGLNKAGSCFSEFSHFHTSFLVSDDPTSLSTSSYLCFSGFFISVHPSVSAL